MSNDSGQVDWRTEHDIRVAGQTASLAELGFGPAFRVGGGDMFGLGFGGEQMATCETCGAAVRILAAEPTDEETARAQPVYLHFKWHRSA